LEAGLGSWNRRKGGGPFRGFGRLPRARDASHQWSSAPGIKPSVYRHKDLGFRGFRPAEEERHGEKGRTKNTEAYVYTLPPPTSALLPAAERPLTVASA
ncbi:unnamed protein product, partial [Musa acuminata subsp. burmannicoides]